jgi:hypothetical protein
MGKLAQELGIWKREEGSLVEAICPLERRFWPTSELPTSRELTRNRRVGQRERGPHESFSLVSPYSSVSKPQGDSPLLMRKGIPVLGRERNSDLHCFSSQRSTYCLTRRIAK